MATQIWASVYMATSFVLASLIVGISTQENRIEYSIFEESPAYTYVGDVPRSANLQQLLNATLVNNLLFSILANSNPNAKFFMIDETDGILRTKERIDREQLCPQQEICKVNLEIAVKSPPDYFDVIKLVIEIKDENDEIPMFAEAQITREIPENTDPGRSFSIPLAEDLDSPQYGVAEYRILSGSPEFKLKVIQDSDGRPSDLYLVLDQAVDREQRELYRTVIAAVDGGNPPNSGTLTVDIVISDVNDHPPSFTNQTYYSSVKENATKGTVVSRVSAVDADFGANGAIVYSFTSRTIRDFGSLFSISNLTGEISVTGALDYETKTSYTLQVTAEDKEGDWLPAEAKCIISVVDVNDNPPKVNLENLNDEGMSIEEGKPRGSYVAYIFVDDPDTGSNGKFSCSLENPDFEIETIYEDEQKAEFTLVTSKQLDREKISQYDLDFVCADQGSPSLTSTTVIRVTVNDVNDNAPVFSNSMYVATVEENKPNNSFVIKVQASDNDEGFNGVVRYYFANDTHDFTVDAITGNVTSNIVLDRERTQNYTLTIKAVDMPRSLPALTSYARVIIRVKDVNDEPPKFNLSKYTFGISETAKFGTRVGQVMARDADSVGTRTARYSTVEQRGSPRKFSVSPNTGEIFTRTLLDRETQSGYMLVVKAVDADDEALSSTVTVSIYVIDVNDNPPTLEFPTLRNNTVHVPNLSGIGKEVTRIIAKDLDSSASSELSYYLSGNGESLQFFSVHERTGQVLTRKSLKEITYKIFNLQILVKDSGVPPNTAQASLRIVINSSLAEANSEPPLLTGNNMIIVISVAVVSSVIVIILVVAIVLVKRKEHNRPKKNYLRNLFADQRVLASESKQKLDSPRSTGKKEVSFSNDVSISDEYSHGDNQHKQIRQMESETAGRSKPPEIPPKLPRASCLATHPWDPVDPSFQIYKQKAPGPSHADPDHDPDLSAADSDSGRGSNEECDSSRPSCSNSLEHPNVPGDAILTPYGEPCSSDHINRHLPGSSSEFATSSGRHVDRSHDPQPGRSEAMPHDTNLPSSTNRGLLYSNNVHLPRTAMLEGQLNRLSHGAQGELNRARAKEPRAPPPAGRGRMNSSYV